MKYDVVCDGVCVLACDAGWSAGRERRCRRGHALTVLGPGAEDEAVVTAPAVILASHCGALPMHLAT